MITPGLLSIGETREGGVHRLTPVGELDLATAPLLESAFDAVFRDTGVEMIVVDLTELAFMDSTGIHLLLRMCAACEDGDRLRVINTLAELRLSLRTTSSMIPGAISAT